MGNGATNPNTASGMLPATSNSSPYIITDVGTLFQYAGGPAWKAFDQVPAIGEASTGSPSDSEYINAGSPGDSGDPDYIPNPMKRGIMVDLGEGNEKTFDKFTFAMCAYTSNYWIPSRIIIQGSNSVGVSSVTDDITAENWDTLFQSFIYMNYVVGPEIGSYTLVDPAPGGGYGSWRPEYFCWINTTAYRYYRVMFGCSEGAIASQAEYNTPWTDEEEWNYGDSSAAVSELRFIEETFVPAGDEVVFVSEIVTGLALGAKCLVSISGITAPTIIINESIAANIYNQYLGIDANTVLMLHMDGENASNLIIDSSAYENVITLSGGLPTLIIGVDQYDLPGFGASCYFPGSYSPGINIANSPLFDLGLSNTPFCIDFWSLMFRNQTLRDEDENYLIRTGVSDSIWNSTSGIMYRFHRTYEGVSFRFNNGDGTCTSLNWSIKLAPLASTPWYHIAVTFDGTTTRLFINGVLQDSKTGSYHKPTTCTQTCIGMPHISDIGASGNGMTLNEFRVSNGVARWTTDFRVPDVPYIEAFTGREVVVPVITTTIIPTVRIVIMPPPLTIPEIASVSSFSLKEITPPGWTVLVPDISSPLEFGAIQNIILHSNVVVSNSLGLRILEVIDKLEIPEILIDAGIIVADVFLGSKIQTPEIVINHSMDVVYNPGWSLVHPDQPIVSFMTMVSSANMVNQLCSSENRLFKSNDAGFSWVEVFIGVPIDTFYPVQALYISEDGQTFIAGYKIYLPEANQVQISYNTGGTWEDYHSYLFDIWEQINTSDESVIYYMVHQMGEGEFLYVSTDGGITKVQIFTDVTYPIGAGLGYGLQWEMLAGNGSGSIIAASRDSWFNDPVAGWQNTGPKVYISSNYGISYTVVDINFDDVLYSSGFVSLDGSVMLVSGTTSELLPDGVSHGSRTRYYLSLDSGVNWEEILPPVETLITDTQYGSSTYLYWTLKISDNGTFGLVTITGGRCYLSTDSLVSWRELHVIGNTDQQWGINECRISSDGSTLFVVLNGVYYESTDHATWKIINPVRTYDTVGDGMWARFAMDSFGQTMIAGTGYLYHSLNKGFTWQSRSNDFIELAFRACAMSDDGASFVSVATAPQSTTSEVIFNSSDYGETVGNSTLDSVLNLQIEGYTNESDLALCGCAISGDGLVSVTGIHTVKLNYDGSAAIASDTYSLLRKINDVWSPCLTTGSWAVAINRTGDIMIAGNGAYAGGGVLGRLYKSIDYGENWIELLPAGDSDMAWQACSVSDDGAVILVCTRQITGGIAGQIFLSNDAGVTWVEQIIPYTVATRADWGVCAVSADGATLYAGGYGLWTNRSISNEVVVVNKTIPEINIVLAPTIDTTNFGKTIIQSVMAQIYIETSTPTIQTHQLSNTTIKYRCVLTGAADNLPDIVIPISSFQCRKSLLSSTEIPISPRQINEVVSDVIPYGYARFCELNPESIFCQAE